MLLDVYVINPRGVVFEGKAKSVIVPGEQGVFEVAVFHRPILSRLLFGTVFVDNQSFPIRRGVIKVSKNKVAIITEEQ